jgi:hypothetical protein
MKKHILIMILLLPLLITGCLVKSLHPFFTEKDIVFDKSLIGNWIDPDSSSWEIRQYMKVTGLFKPEKPDPTYLITFKDKKGTGIFHGRLFRLENQLYIDFYPEEIDMENELMGFHMVPSHSLAKIELLSGKIIIRWYNEEWLLNLFKQNRIRIAHERIPYENGSYNDRDFQVVLTAPTEDLQKFIKKYGNDPKAFSNENNREDYTFVLTRKKQDSR